VRAASRDVAIPAKKMGMDGSTRLARRASVKHVVVVISQEVIVRRVIIVIVIVV
jgi:hypothetical protein